jgi:CubicO group peptidase (beta-lactamase class C family)
MRTIVLALLLTATAAQAQQTYFPPIVGNTWETVDPAALGWCTDQLPALNSFLQQNNTKAFIVLKDGRIAIEQYFGTFTQDSLWYWASAGKSLTAFLVGKAQEEGSLDINAPSSTYLGTGWTSCTPAQEAAITVRNQLTMTSGLDDTGDLDCTAPSCLTYLAEPGTRWSYHNAPYTLLDGVITGATGQTLNSYLFNKLTLTTGLQGAFVQVGSNNVFFSKARALARFGLLALAQGQWNGNPVMSDAAYFEAMVTPSQTLNPAYGYLWWLNGQQSYLLPGIQLQLPGPLMPDAPLDTYSAMGKNGQLCNVSPATGLVVVRMGDLPGGIFVPNVFNNEIWQYLNAVICLPTAVDAPHRANVLAIYPNPASDQITVSMAGAIPQRITVRGADGREYLSVQQLGKVDTSLLPPGTYLVEATGADGAVVRNKLIIAR